MALLGKCGSRQDSHVDHVKKRYPGTGLDV